MYNNFFEQIDSEEKAYWLGFIAADGNINQKHSSITIELQRADRHHLEKFAKCFDNYYEVKDQDRKFPSSKISIYSKKCCEDLINYGIVPAKSKVLKINWEKINPIFYKDIIRGYFDGDGSIYCSKPQRLNGYNYDEWGMNFIGSEHTLIFIQKFLGLKNFPRKKDGVYSLDCGGTLKTYECLQKLYENATIYLDRKKEKYLKLQSSQRLNNLVSKRDYNAEQKSTSSLLGFVAGGATIRYCKAYFCTADRELLVFIKKFFDSENYETVLFIECGRPILRVNLPEPTAKKYRHLFYPNQNKTITREILNEMDLTSLIIWFAMKGRKKDEGILLNTAKFSEEENNKIIQYLKVIYNINPTLHLRKNLYQIYINKEDSKLLLEKGCVPRDNLVIS